MAVGLVGGGQATLRFQNVHYIYGWTSDLMEFELKFLFATMIPVSATFVLLMYSITPEQPKTVENTEN